jgi:WD40 repeat protein
VKHFSFVYVDLSGSQDGSVSLWEWDHSTPISQPRLPGTYAKVTRVRFSQHGNKFGVSDADGNVNLWQLGLNSLVTRPFYVSIGYSLAGPVEVPVSASPS